MTLQKQQILDPRQAQEIRDALLARRPGYLPQWSPPDRGTEAALIWAFARYLESVIQRLNQAPDKNKLAFLDLLGIDLVPARPARAPVVFQLSRGAPNTRAAAGTQVVAPPPPESSDQIVFETEQSVGLTSATLKQLYSLWPNRDQYINHSQAVADQLAFRPFRRSDLEDTDHCLYIAHDKLLALSGSATVNLTFDLVQNSSEHLDMVWEYWDGEVWRHFRDMDEVLVAAGQPQLDGTAGLTRSGRILLTTDCAETKEKAVNGSEAFWIRGCLRETLPPDPAQILPLVESLSLSTVISNPLSFDVSVTLDSTGSGLGQVTVLDGDNAPIPGLTLDIDLQGGQTFLDGQVYDISGTAPIQLGTGSHYGNLQLGAVLEPFVIDIPTAIQDAHLQLTVEGLQAEQAISVEGEQDVSKPFFPFGPQPQPGSTFYFRNDEVLAKPGAQFSVYVQRAATPQDQIGFVPNPNSAQRIGTAVPLSHTVIWEYWNGSRWVALGFYTGNGVDELSPLDFSGTGVVDFPVPDDIEPTEVEDNEGFWIRVRLVSGGYGLQQTVTVDGNTFQYVIARPPAIGDLRFGYTWQHGPFPPEEVLTYNDFQYEDHTGDARWPGQVFQPFTLLQDVTPALYLGFDQTLPVDRFNLYFDIDEDPAESEGPELVWEYYDGGRWQRLTVEDKTNRLRTRGMVSFIGPADSEALARFGESLHWIRARLKEDGPPGTPTINRIWPNAVWAVQRQTIVNELIGTGTGLPDQLLTFRQLPILPGEVIEVRELSGARANVEWRILAMELLGNDYSVIQEIEEMLRGEGPQTEFSKGDLRFERDRHKRVTSVWVRWKGQDHLYASKAEDRHYVLEYTRGRLIFGDGVRGKVVPLGASIMARRYVVGGGRRGNVEAGAISQLLGGIGGVDSLSNPVPAQGGADAETLPAVIERGPQTLHHRGRALTVPNYETMAKEASAAVAVARALPARDAQGRPRPGWVTLIIIPHSKDSRPWPTIGLREQVRNYIGERAPADIVAAAQLHVTGPVYQELDVEAVIAPDDPAQAGVVEQATRQALLDFLHPLYGGPERRGWAAGRDVFLSDVAAILERVEGVDYVSDLSFFTNDVLQGEQAGIDADKVVVAGQILIRMVVE